jgi:hypothetical protein
VKKRLALASIVVLLIAAPMLRAQPSLPPTASLTDEQAQTLFDEANGLFRRGNELSRTDPVAARNAYRGAVIRFERIVADGGIHNGKLYYNIGNAYFRLDDLGRTILNYRRAGQFLSGDENLTQNLRYARSRRADQIEQKQETQVLEALLFWHYDLSAGTRTVIFAVFFLAFWALASLRLFFSGRIPGALLAACAALALLFLGSLAWEMTAGNRGGGVILAEQVTARKGDGDTYEPSFNEPLHAGTEFELLEDRGDWYQVELADGQRCWIPAASAGLVRPEAG